MHGTDLILLHAAVNPECRGRVDKTFDYHTIQLITRGSVRFCVDDDEQRLDGRWTWSSPLGPRVRFESAVPGKSWHHRYAAFTGPLAVSWARAGLLPNRPEPVDAPTARQAATALEESIKHASAGGRWDHLRAVNALERALLILGEKRRTAGDTTEPTAWLDGVIDRLGDAEGPELDLAGEASRLAVGLTTLRRRLRETLGMSPHAYRLQRKTAAARRLLGETDLSVKQIAARLGYCDVYHFSKDFRQRAGVTASSYRRSRQSA